MQKAFVLLPLIITLCFSTLLPFPKPCRQLCKIGSKCVYGLCLSTDICSVNADCPTGEICSAGKCIEATPIPIDPPPNSRCKTVKCSSGFICQNGECVKDPNIYPCPLDQKYKFTVCTEPRPTDITCPVLYYIRAPDPLFCGVKADGTRVDFPRDC